ncbi:glycosyltransferase family 9 protein [Massilia sp. TSP1-1-2]|uniref:glycosyltransferase family 9 protein n=1 Tax=Massilia sp. TSP1-1-2 TaxID=2804649 RepID=UPI003CF3C27B
MSVPVLHDARKIAVFRPNAVGDFMFCLPALHALRSSYPEAEIVYLGLPWHAQFLAGRPGPVDRVAVVPPLPGIGGAGAAAAAAAAAAADGFLDAMRAEKFDLALQMFGGGRHANPLLAQFNARLSAGMRTADAAPLDRCIVYRTMVNQRLQLLEVAALAGAKAWPMKRQLQATLTDRQLAAQLVPASPGQRLVIVQPGASDARRCWPAARFAAVADALVEEGALVAINGSAAEAAIVGAVIEAMRYPAINLSGKASLNALCGLLERATLLVSNDTGPLHMALALDRACVGVYWFTNLIEAAPLCQHAHRAALSTRVHCSVCGMENTARRCEHDASFVDDVSLEEVTALAIDLFRAAR